MGVTFDSTSDNYRELKHYGIKRKSGRYPWGSGETEEQRGRDFLSYLEQVKAQGISEADALKAFGMNSTDLRAARTTARNEVKQADIARAYHLKYEKGLSNVAIGREMGINESVVRGLLDPAAKEKADILMATANMLKDEVAEKQFVDIGTGVEHKLSISDTKLKVAVKQLEEEGYAVHKVQVDQVGSPGNKTTIRVLAPPGTTYRDIVTNMDKIQQVGMKQTDDGGKTWLTLQPPISIDSKRVAVRYAEEGGADADGVIYVRPGVNDITLNGSRYAQVRIAVDGSHYLKGMAVYKDDLPKGVDLMFNTNKSDTGNKLDAMKPLKKDAEGNIDKDNPFGSMIAKQIGDRDESGNLLKVTSAMNIVNDEGDWDRWSKNLSTQLLSKQSPQLAKTQLDMTFEKKQNDLNAIMKLTNPSVRKKLLESYADEVDSSAIHLKAAALPRQRTQVIIPIESLKDNQIYAPNFRNGEKVVLVRFPHGGTFEIPELTVNNANPEARRTLGTGKGAAKDAVGINARVAERLSGADFDGDTVLVIPNTGDKIRTSPALEGLKGFDPKQAYPKYEGMKPMTSVEKGFQMGDVSNLITDMTIKGATPGELARAVRHSMVVIDAEKHELNWKLSHERNGIAALKEKYQGASNAGAATLISRATSRKDVRARKKRAAADGGFIDRETGEKVYVETGESWENSKGKTVYRMQRSQKLKEAKDAHELVSDDKTLMETIYADHSNRLKALANQARKEMVNTKTIPYDPDAKKTYANEVKDLDAKLRVALANAPRERQAQVVANTIVAAKRQANPDLESSELKKIKAQALIEARARTGANKTLVNITDREWDAIQAGAITANKLDAILRNADVEKVKALATPRVETLMSSAKTARAEQMLSRGYTQAEVADALGVSLSTLKKEL